MNKVLLIDNVGRDPEMKYLPSGQVEGRVSLRKYDLRGGGHGASLDVNVSNFQFLGRRDGHGAPASGGGSGVNDEDELPR